MRLKVFTNAIAIVNLVLLGSCSTASGEKDQMVNTASWYNSWKASNGIPRTPHASIDTVELQKQVESNPEWWKAAFTFLKDSNLAELKPGKHVIDSTNVFALVSESIPARDTAKPDWEVHEQYADIHIVLTGKEQIALAPLSAAEVSIPYDATKDIGFYYASGEIYPADTTNFFIVFPGIVHCPQIKTAGSGTVKKVVVKVKLKS